MTTQSPDELLRLWAGERLSVDMAVGHMLQNLVQQQASISALQMAVARLNAIDRSPPDQSPNPPRSSTKRATPRKR
jgi:hypothetical protein